MSKVRAATILALAFCAACKPRAVPPVEGLVLPAATFEGDIVKVPLPEPWAQAVEGGSGRFLIFHLKQAEQAVVVDLPKGQIVKTIPNVPDGTLLAAGAEKLLFVVPSRRSVERWSLTALEREKVGVQPTKTAPRIVAMGCAGTGPLLVASADEAVLIDIETLAPMAIEGKPIGATGRHGYVIDASADGRTFAGIPTGYGPVAYSLMAIEGGTLRTGRFGSTSHAVRWARPGADGSVIFTPGGGAYASSLTAIAAKWLDGSQSFPTAHPSFFLAVHFVTRGGDGLATRLWICTSGDRKAVHTIERVDEMTPRGGDQERYLTGRRLAHHTRRFFYAPLAQTLATLPWDNKSVVVRRLDLLAELKASGKDYLIVTSVPPTLAERGRTVEYQIAAVAKAGGVRCTLESGPPGARVTRRGRVTWRVPKSIKEDQATILVSVRAQDGQEAFHTIHLRIRDAGPAKPPQQR